MCMVAVTQDVLLTVDVVKAHATVLIPHNVCSFLLMFSFLFFEIIPDVCSFSYVLMHPSSFLFRDSPDKGSCCTARVPVLFLG